MFQYVHIVILIQVALQFDFFQLTYFNCYYPLVHKFIYCILYVVLKYVKYHAHAYDLVCTHEIVWSHESIPN